MFIERQGVLANMFCRHDKTQDTPVNPGVSPIVCQQGCIVTVVGCDGETTIVKKMESCDEKPFGWLLHEVRTPYNHEYMPYGAIMAKDMGSIRTFVGHSVGVAHLGIYDTNVVDPVSGGINANDDLYPSASGTLTTVSGSGYCGIPVAVACNSLTQEEIIANRYLRIKCLI